MLFLLGAAVLGAYSNSFSGDFVWDDHYLIVENPYVKNARHAWVLFSRDFWDFGEMHDRFRSFYRPLVSLSYLADFGLWNLNPAGFHLTNVYAHFLATFLAFLFLRLLVGSNRLALSASAIFALHPAHVESVAWISGRTDVLCALFLFGALWTYLLSDPTPGAPSVSSPQGGLVARRRSLFRALSIAAFTLSLSAKEMSLTLPLLLVLVDLARFPETPLFKLLLGRRWKYLPYVAVLTVYLGVRLIVLGSLATNPMRPSPLTLAISGFHVLARYFGLLALPVALDSHHPDLFVSSPTLPWAVEAIGVVSIAILTLVFYRQRSAYFFPLAWTGLTLAPVMNLGGFGDVILAERFLYVPSLGFSLLLALLFEDSARGCSGQRTDRGGWSRIQPPTVVFFLLLVLLGGRTWRRNQVWHDDVALFSTAAITSPDSAYIHTNLGIALFRAGKTQKAIEHYQRSLELAPDSSLTHNNLGVAMESLGDREGASRNYAVAIRLAPRDGLTYFNMGNIEKEGGNCRKALWWYEGAVRRKPGYGEALTNMGTCYLALNDLARAAPVLEEALSTDATLEKAWNNLGTVHFRRGEYARAEKAYLRASLLAPSNPLPLANRAEAFAKLGNEIKAEAEFRRVLTRDPGYPQALEGLARLLVRTGRAEEGARVLEEHVARGAGGLGAAFLLGQAYEASGRAEDATKLYRSLLTLEGLSDGDRQRIEQKLGSR